MPDMKSIISKLEAATGPSRELDAEIEIAEVVDQHEGP